MRDYELVMVINPEVADEGVTAAIEKVSRFVTQRGGVVAQVNNWGKRKLAYPIDRFIEGTYVLTELKLEPKIAPELEASLRISEEVLRHLLVRLEK